MGIVTGLREFRGVVIVALDGCDALRVRRMHFEKRPLAEGEAVDPQAYEDSIAAIQLADAYEAALTALDSRARTARELERALLNKGYVRPAVEAAVERLRENRLIDDARIAGRIAESSAGKPVGVYALRRKLKAKGISDEDADAALEAFDDDQQQAAARRAAEKLLKRYEGLPRREARAKLSQALARRGFGWDSVRASVDALLSDDSFD